jgi:prepilin peptidase CpaA
MPNFIISLCIPGILLGASVYTDLKYKKVQNKMLLYFLPIVLVARFFDSGMDGVLQGFIASFIAMALCIPLVTSKALGAGDMKLLMVFGFTSHMEAIFWIILYSFVWGAVLGIIKVLLDKELMSLLKNTMNIVSREKEKIKNLHSIPFTIAILLGWMSHLVLTN